MGRRLQAQRLHVWLNGQAVGYWDVTQGRHAFSYFDEWCSDEAGRPLSLSLPFQPFNVAYHGAIVQNYFDNLLPDSQQIRHRMAVKPINSWQRWDVIASARFNC